MDVEGVTADGTIEALLIAGPTASGKSALALALAERLGGVVVNADSMQVYADLPILSAQPGHNDRARAPHRLFGTIDGADAYSLGRWLADASEAIVAARRAGRLPIVVGGTGLYFKALTQGLSTMPDVPDDVRARLRAEAEGVAPEALHARLAALDPVAAARLRPSDPQRILRALEIVAVSARSITAFQAMREPPVLPLARARAVFLMPERPALVARLTARFLLMMVDGALAEVEALAARRLDPALPVMRALGVPPLLAHLAGTMTSAAATEAAIRETRAYARRQMTFGRHQLSGFVPVTPEAAEAAILGAL